MTSALSSRSEPRVTGCFALPTMSGHSPSEQPSDLPFIYEWFGQERCIGRKVMILNF